MKWYRTKEKNPVKQEAIAFFMREDDYDEYENGIFTVKKVAEDYYIILHNKDENIDILNLEDEKQEINRKIELEYQNNKFIVESLIAQMGGEFFVRYGLGVKEIEMLGSFKQMGGARLKLNNNKIVRIALNYSDLYDIQFFDGEKIEREYKDVYFDEIIDILLD
ncbi:hypothetical protein [Fusobacterium ulcerans]|uniref:Uncharacterized protein n=1 Tax=Fusobacterium ulcerans 12-1B TaxID=457404 RepID=H1PYN5_9FUSO|nr:hypothetical protein [Fusobacterium ulcerans]EHO77224.1 hypothetical protein HMPREF0402_03528 [Fusobacterium ulcerans 12-1B]